MNGRSAKLLRKIAKLTSRSDSYIKNEYKKMIPALQVEYLVFMKENLRRIAEVRKNPPVPKDTIVMDQKIETGKEG